MRYLLLVVLMGWSTGIFAGQPVAGDEIADEAFVSWKAVIDKVSDTGEDRYRVRAKLDFQGRTSDGNQIRGAGKLRFIGEPNQVFEIGDALRGSDSLRYWATLKIMMGGDLGMIQGTGILDFATTGSVLTTEGVIEFKAALEIYKGA